MPLSRVPLFVLACAISHAQEMPKAFDVASIKPNASSDNRVMVRVQPGGGFSASGMTLKQLMLQAYNVREFQITGGPGWISSDRYDINAKAEGLPDRVAPDQMRPLLRNLIEDRFKLKTHTESKEMPIYALVPAKSGHKLKVSEAGDGPGPMIRIGRGQINGKSMPMSLLVQQLSGQLGRKVVDQTGLTGAYEILLEWTPEPGQGGGVFGGPPAPDAIQAVDTSSPTIFTALQEQLGLRLEPQKGPVEIIVIDSVEKPSEN